MMWLWLWGLGCTTNGSTDEAVESDAIEANDTPETVPVTVATIDTPPDSPVVSNNEAVLDGMVKIPEGLVDLGPRHIEAVKGYTLPMNPMGVTPDQGQGANQRSAGGPPLPGQPMNPPNGKPNGNGPNGKGPNGNGPNNQPIGPNGKPTGTQNGQGSNFPQHKPKFDLNQPQNGGVGHVRPGSGVPSAPPNMPGSKSKFVGEEQPWTANPSNQMKPKRVTVSSFWMDTTEVTRTAYQGFLEATGYRPPFIAEDWAQDGWNWNGTAYPEGTGDHPVVMVSWYDAQEFCAWKEKRLPTEAEWQLAALGDARLENNFPWGKEYNHDALNHGQIESPNFDDSDGYLHTSPVGAFPAGQSTYGLEDTFGNAWEFTADARRATWKFYDNADDDDLNNTMAPGPSLYVGVRGGAYFFDLRPNPGGERNEFLTEVRRKTAGFRCAKS